MTKRRKRMLLGGGLAVGLIFFGVLFVDMGAIRTLLESKIAAATGAETRISRLTLSLLPSPHVSLHQIQLNHPAGQVTLGALEVYPVLWDLVRGQLTVSSVHLKQPEIRISDLGTVRDLLTQESGKPQTSKALFPDHEMELTVEDGRLTLPLNGPLEGLDGSAKPPEMSDIDLDIQAGVRKIRAQGGFKGAYMGSAGLGVELVRAPGDNAWDVNAQVLNADITSIRRILLVFFPEQKVVKQLLGDIVKAGHVSSAEFRFQGKTSEWTDIHRMTINADAEGVLLHIPHTNLFLEQVSGQIRIEDGVLKGRNLSAILNNSKGGNGVLTLDLGSTDLDFSADIDLDADMADIPGAIEEFLPAGVREELAGIKNPRGRSTGHLALKQSEGDITVKVQARPRNVSFYLDRLEQTVDVREGALVIDSQSLGWKDLSGRVGPHELRGSDGIISWDHELLLEIKRCEASLDGGALYDQLVANEVLSPKVRDRLSDVSGALDIQGFTLRGNPSRLDAVVWNGIISTRGLTMTSAYLSHPLTLITPGVRLDRESIEFKSVTARMGDQALNVSGRLDDLLSDTRRGELKLQGTLVPASKKLLQKKGWIPDAVMPNLPCELAPLSLGWRQGRVSVSGVIRHFGDHGRTVETDMAMLIGDDGVRIERLNIRDGEQRAEIKASIPFKPDSGDLTISFKGALKHQTLEVILNDRARPTGDVSGDFRWVYPGDSGKKILWQGRANVSAVTLELGENSVSLDQGRVEEAAEGRVAVDIDGLLIERPDTPGETFLSTVKIVELSGLVFFLEQRKAQVAIEKGSVCGIRVAGEFELPSLAMNLSLEIPEDKPLPLDELCPCLGVHQTEMDGRIGGQATLAGAPDMISQGHFDLRAEKGVIHKAKMLSKILAVLDLTELFSDNPVKNLMTTGYRYDSIDVVGTITGHNMHLSRIQVVGAGVNLYGTGYVDLGNQSLDMTVMASPFKTVDTLVTSIPVVGKVLGGKNKSLVSVPLRVEGHLSEPEIRVLPRISKVSSNILDAFANTFKRSFELSNEFVTGDKPEDNTSDSSADTQP